MGDDFMQTSTMNAKTKASALRRQRQKAMRAKKIKLIRANFMLWLSLFVDLVAVVTFDYLNFMDFDVIPKILSLAFLMGLAGLTLIQCDRISELSGDK